MEPAASIVRPRTLPKWTAVLELLKPITWFAPMWAFGCGVVSSGVPIGGRWPIVIAGVLLAGPLVCATSQAVNDWFDRHVDAINEPDRPIPSGRMPGRWGLYVAIGWTVLSLLVATALGPWGFGAAVVGLALAWAYSAPPLRLKRNGWWGNSAVGLCYEGLPWFTGAAVMAATRPDWRIVLVALIYSARRARHHDPQRLQVGRGRPPHRHRLAAGAARRRDRGTRSPASSWPRRRSSSSRCWSPGASLSMPPRCSLLLLAQLGLMARLLAAPCAIWPPWYNATGTTLYVLGMLVSAFALRSDRCA